MTAEVSPKSPIGCDPYSSFALFTRAPVPSAERKTVKGVHCATKAHCWRPQAIRKFVAASTSGWVSNPASLEVSVYGSKP